MATNHPKAGPNLVPAYQLSGVPYVTSSLVAEVGSSNPIKISFPYVTRFFQVENIGANDLRFGFSAAGVKGTTTSNYINLPVAAGTGSIYELRCKDLYFLSKTGTTGFRVIAGLTTIDRDQFPVLTGSVNGTASFDGIG